MSHWSVHLPTPSLFNLFLKTHFVPITFLSSGLGTSVQVLFFYIQSNSSFIVSVIILQYLSQYFRLNSWNQIVIFSDFPSGLYTSILISYNLVFWMIKYDIHWYYRFWYYAFCFMFIIFFIAFFIYQLSTYFCIILFIILLHFWFYKDKFFFIIFKLRSAGLIRFLTEFINLNIYTLNDLLSSFVITFECLLFVE